MTIGMPPFSLLLWSPLRVSLSAFCTSKRCFQIHPNRFHLACKHFTQTYTFSLFLPPRAFQEGYKIPTTVTDRRDFPAFALSPQAFRQNERVCRPLVAGSKPFWLLEYFRIKFYLSFKPYTHISDTTSIVFPFPSRG